MFEIFEPSFFKRYRVAKRLHSLDEVKLNLGCGADKKPGWINVDSGAQFGAGGIDLKHNLAKGLPFPDNSTDFIFHEHFIEHLTREQASVFLKDCYRVLKPKAVMRIACPDLRMIIDDYLNNSFQKRQWLQKFAGKYLGRSRCELLNISMRDWGHQYIYDAEDLMLVLAQSGFAKEDLQVCSVSKSNYAQLQGLETREDSLVIEAKKGG